MGDLAPIAGFDTFLDQEYRHFAFIATPLPNDVELAARTVKIIAEAERSLGRLDAAKIFDHYREYLQRPAPL